MRRSLIAAAIALLVGAGAAAAAPQTSIEFWTISLQPFFTAYVQRLIDTYERAHPGVRVRWIDVQPQAIDQKLLAAIAGGVAPDVVNLNTEGTIRMAEVHALVDMDAAVPAAARGRYFPNIWASTRLDGRAYGIPWYVVPDVLAYNRALFRRAGLDPARPPATEDAFVRAAVAIKQRTGAYGFMPNVDNIRMLKRFQEDGLPILSADRKRAVFDSPAHVALLARYVALYKEGMFPDDTLRRGYLGATERYAAGQLAMLVTGPQFLLRVRSDSPGVYQDTLVAPAPLGRAHGRRGPVLHAGGDEPRGPRARDRGPGARHRAGPLGRRAPQRRAVPDLPRGRGERVLRPHDAAAGPRVGGGRVEHAAPVAPLA